MFSSTISHNRAPEPDAAIRQTSACGKPGADGFTSSYLYQEFRQDVGKSVYFPKNGQATQARS